MRRSGILAGFGEREGGLYNYKGVVCSPGALDWNTASLQGVFSRVCGWWDVKRGVMRPTERPKVRRTGILAGFGGISAGEKGEFHARVSRRHLQHAFCTRTVAHSRACSTMARAALPPRATHASHDANTQTTCVLCVCGPSSDAAPISALVARAAEPFPAEERLQLDEQLLVGGGNVVLLEGVGREIVELHLRTG